jgi:hydrophobic/amphiphilic exporter-1 (mainly G- bacteria), HAE1 family
VTLTPVLSAIFLAEVGKDKRKPFFFRLVDRAINAVRSGYRRALPVVLNRPVIAFLCLAVLLAFTGWRFTQTPTGFIPDEDQGFFIVIGQAPEGVSLDYTRGVQADIEAVIRRQPEVANMFDAGGFSFTGSSSNKVTMFVLLKPWSERRGSEHTLNAVLQRVNYGLFTYPKAQAFAFNPPSIPGLGFLGGFDFELEDRGNAGIPALLGAAYQIIGPANAPNSGLSRVYTTFDNSSPSITIDVDREKAKNLGVNLTDLFGTLQVYLGSVYVNDFTLGEQSYRVYVQADTPYRSRISDLQNVFVRGTPSPGTAVTSVPSGAAGQIPLTSVVDLTQTKSAPVITHYNLFRSIDIGGSTAPGVGTGQGIDEMDKLASHLPPGFAYEWTGITLEQIEGGSQAAMIFALGIVFVFLVLSAQYESFADPLIILMAVPLALLGALLGLWLRHFVSDVFAQVGYVMLIGLASKNAILIVEFANQLRASGVDIVSAARQAAETRLRPILMTSIAFCLGVTPLVFATGAGAFARNSLGTVVFGGMIVSTVLNLFITPALYVIIASLESRFRPTRHGPPPGSTNGSAGVPPRSETPATI